MLSKPSVEDLSTESIEGTSLPLEGIDDIHSGDSLPLGVFGVGDGITDDVLKEDLEDTTGLLVDQARDTLDTSTSRQTADGGLGDTLNVITQYFAMTLGASFAESFSSFSSSSHVELVYDTDEDRSPKCCLYTEARALKPAFTSHSWSRDQILVDKFSSVNCNIFGGTIVYLTNTCFQKFRQFSEQKFSLYLPKYISNNYLIQ